MNPSDNPQTIAERTEVPLRIRFYPLWWLFFVGSVLLAQTFLVTRLWGGWNARALLQLVAFQVFLLPRIVLFAAAISLGLTLLTSRLVHWIARPLSRKWLAPIKILPPESEIPLYLRTSERTILKIPARRRSQNIWEPGWLILTDARLLWLSGIWRTICWEIDARDLDRPLATRIRLGRKPRWFGGYVVGMPHRVIADRGDRTEDAGSEEVLAIVDPAGFVRFLTAMSETKTCEGKMPSADPATERESDRAGQATTQEAKRPGDSNYSRSMTDTSIFGLPPLRDYSRASRRHRHQMDKSQGSDGLSKPEIVRNIVLPPRRNLG